MSNTPAHEDEAFGARVQSELRSAASVVEPDVERALQRLRERDTGGRRPQRVLAVAAALALLGAGVLGANRLSSSSVEVLVGPAGQTVTTASPAPVESSTVTTAGVAGSVATIPDEVRPVSAAEIPAVASPLVGGDAVLVQSELSSPASTEPFVFVDVFVDDGRVLAADSADGPFELRVDDTTSQRREALSSTSSSGEWRAAMLAAGGLVEPTASVAEQNDRLWDDAWDLLASMTLTDAQRTALFAHLEVELGVAYAVLPAGLDVGEALEIRWDGHTEVESRALYLDLVTGAPILYVVGEVFGSDDLTAVIDYSVRRVAVADLDVAPRPSTEEPGVDDVAVALDGDGLRAIDPETGTATLVPFGEPRSQVVAMVTRSFGAPGSETPLPECGGGPLTAVGWGALSLYFAPTDSDPDSAAFLGWAVNGEAPVITTVDGLGWGITTEALVAARSGEIVADSTLGWELFDGSITWLSTGIAGDGVIDALWAGASCVFR